MYSTYIENQQDLLYAKGHLFMNEIKPDYITLQSLTHCVYDLEQDICLLLSVSFSVGCRKDEYGIRWEKALYTKVQLSYFVNSKILFNGIWKGCGEEQSTRSAFRSFATWEVKKKIWKSLLLELRNHGIALAFFICYVHECSFLTFEFLSCPAFLFTNLLPDSCQSFHTGSVTSIFRLPRRPKERPAGVGFLTLNFPSVLSLAVAVSGPASNDLNADWMPMSFFCCC